MNTRNIKRLQIVSSPWSMSLLVFFGVAVIAILFSSSALAVDEYINPLAATNPQTNTVEEIRDFQFLITVFLLALQKIVAFLALVFMVLGALIYITSAGDEKRLSWAKGALFGAAVGLAIAIAAPLFLKEIGIILGWISPTTVAGYGTSLSLTQVIANVLAFLLAILGVVAIIALVIGGFMYLTSAGDADRADSGKGIVKYSIIGIVVALAGLVIITQVAKFFA